MPRRRRYGVKRRRTRSTYRRRRKRWVTRYKKKHPLVNIVSMHRFGWPKQAKQTFKYGRRFNITSSGGNVAALLNIRANAPQDPEASLGGDNAYGWDQFMGTLYDRCYVYAAKITVTFTPLPGAPYYGGIHTHAFTSTSLTTPELFMNQPNEPYVTLSQYGAPKKMTRVINIRKWLPFAAKDDLASDSLSNPAQTVDFQIWCTQGNPASTTALTFTGDYSIEYYCILGRQDIMPPSV